ncbi:aminoacyl-tRNA hydrolase [Leptolyngbya sp. PCC 6406]|uniref:aminoacyl-tRNA hydrolase n=1 Tax=Leptolyngbya sp. PCC 6406 TaxID=1173264 RepID=UPI0002ACE715|nr:aminoacyl-tRNA hydrolase [Leptolyngbya sp. PCC 6406]
MADDSATPHLIIPRLVVGLGNPGEKYAKTRHNIGFEVVDTLAHRWQVALASQAKFQGIYGEGWAAGHKVGLLKPQTYMNRSGQSVRAVLDWYKVEPEAVLVIYDDMDLATGRLRLRLSGSAGGHNGMKSLIAHLGGQDFPRLRLGIGRTATGEPGDRAVVAHVLGRPSAAERAHMEEVVTLAADVVEMALREGVEKAMSRFNGRTIEAPSALG